MPSSWLRRARSGAYSTFVLQCLAPAPIRAAALLGLTVAANADLSGILKPVPMNGVAVGNGVVQLLFEPDGTPGGLNLHVADLFTFHNYSHGGQGLWQLDVLE
jgi:hypothetical protein